MSKIPVFAVWHKTNSKISVQENNRGFSFGGSIHNTLSIVAWGQNDAIWIKI